MRKRQCLFDVKKIRFRSDKNFLTQEKYTLYIWYTVINLSSPMKAAEQEKIGVKRGIKNWVWIL